MSDHASVPCLHLRPPLRAAFAVLALVALVAIGCRSDALSPAALGGSGLKLDIRIRKQCMIALASQAAGELAADDVLAQIPLYSPMIKTLSDANGMCRDHWGVGGARADECVDRLAILVG